MRNKSRKTQQKPTNKRFINKGHKAFNTQNTKVIKIRIKQNNSKKNDPRRNGYIMEWSKKFGKAINSSLGKYLKKTIKY